MMLPTIDIKYLEWLKHEAMKKIKGHTIMMENNPYVMLALVQLAEIGLNSLKNINEIKARNDRP